MSDSLRPHGLQHTRLSCLSLSPWACSNSRPLSWWCHPTISSSVVPFPSCLQSFPASGSRSEERRVGKEWRQEDDETPILCPPDVKNWLTGKDPDAEEDWRREEKGKTEDEMVGWHHQLNGHEFEQSPGCSEGQGTLVCCGPWGHKEADITYWLNNNSVRHWLTL